MVTEPGTETQHWKVTDIYLSDKKYTYRVLCPCGAEWMVYKHQINASGKRCSACGGKCNRDGTYTPPASPTPKE